MRIIQLIDSLEAGGAERMAVNYANSLVDKIEFSGLVATRKEGALLKEINPKVAYFFLNRKKKVDLQALLKLKRFVKFHKVTHIHAHSSSFFLAFLLKAILPSLKIIWHDHYGNNEYLDSRPYFILKLVTTFFRGTIVVNQNLKKWSENVLKAQNVLLLPNFALKEIFLGNPTVLKGFENKRVVCLANLRVQKNHYLLIDVALKLKETHPDWSFHFIGKDFKDDYSVKIKKAIEINQLKSSIFIYDSRQDIDNILKQSTIAVLSSQSEGLPVALLEYGLYKMPVIITNVGAVDTIIENAKNGLLVASNDSNLFYTALVQLIENENFRENLGTSLFKTIETEYEASNIIIKYINWMQTL